MLIPVHHCETREVVGHMDWHTRVYRYEPEAIATPMTTHETIYTRMAYEFGWDYLYVVTEFAYDELRRLRDSQGYFDEGDKVLRTATLGMLVANFGSTATVLTDVNFNMSVLGLDSWSGYNRGSLIVIRRRPGYDANR